jgi:uncharacterized protein (DUF1015 family)
MVEVIPFKGITYNPKIISKLDDVMSPPYDIISEKMQSQLYEKNPKNFVRIILGKIKEDDSETENRYTRAKKLFDTWLKDSTLMISDKPAIFPYKIQYQVKNKSLTMNGFFILLKIDPEYNLVKAHERTLSKPKTDRLNLMQSCHVNFEPIQLLYIDENDEIRKNIESSINDPIINVKGYDGFNHKLWRLEDENIISMIQNKLKNKILFIADGHHRYQTAINFASELKEKTGDKDNNSPYNYRMVILANMFDEGLSIFPTHRLIKKADVDVNNLLQKLKQYFVVEEKIIDSLKNNINSIITKIKENLETKDEHKFVMYMKGKYCLLTLKSNSFMDDFAKDRSKTWRTLDVSILHKIILEHLMGINQENLENHVKYTRVDEEAIEFVNEGKYDISFIMNPTKIEELKAIADAGEHMPQKSTYFLPKMLSGLVMYKM